MNRLEVDEFTRSTPGTIPAERQNMGIVLAYLGDAGGEVANLTRQFSYDQEADLINEIRALGLEGRFESAAIFFLRSVGRHFAEARGGSHRRSTHFMR